MLSVLSCKKKILINASLRSQFESTIHNVNTKMSNLLKELGYQ